MCFSDNHSSNRTSIESKNASNIEALELTKLGLMYQTTAFLQHTIKRIEDQHLQTTLDANQFSQNKSSSISPLHLLVVQYSPRFYVAVSALCVVVVVLLPSSMLSCSLPGELLTLRLVRAVASLLLLLLSSLLGQLLCARTGEERKRANVWRVHIVVPSGFVPPLAWGK